MDFSGFEIRKCPPTAIYIPNFITSEEEQRILSHVARTPKPKWTQLSERRLISYGGIPHANGMIAEELPAWLQAYVDKINNLGIFETCKANHVLVNEYEPGQGIMPHTDGPIYYPIVSTISCGAHTVLEFAKCYSNEIEFKLLLEPRSLFILKESLYTDYMHTIRGVKEDKLCDRIYNYELCENTYKMGDTLARRRTRISLTIRNVPKTTKLKLKTDF